MSPFEAGQIELEEPDWRDVFEEECGRKPHLPRYLRQVDGFEATLKRWRQFHATRLPDGKHQPATAVEAIVALANHGILAPRSTWRDLPRDGVMGFQCDDHCWLLVAGRQMRVVAIEDKMLYLEAMTFDAQKPERREINLTTAKWSSYIESAVVVLEAMRARPPFDDEPLPGPPSAETR